MILKRILFVILGLLLLAVLHLAVLTIFEYRPKPTEPAEYSSGSVKLEKNRSIKLISWNIGYCGLGKYNDFFMDGGKEVRPKSKKIVKDNITGIFTTLINEDADIVMNQEVDLDSKRSYRINEFVTLKNALRKNGAFTYNFKCLYVPYPIPTIGKVESGLSTITDFETISAERKALPVPFKWPVRIGNLKRAMLVTRIPVYENGIKSEKNLVIVNLHLEAFDDGQAKIEQTKVLYDFIKSEYEKGNYVIAGGDFNQTFPKVHKEKYPVLRENSWHPGVLNSEDLPEDWTFACDDSLPTCRSTGAPYVGEAAESHNWQCYVIDGFILSPNVKLNTVNVMNQDFEFSDHNPVKIEIELK